MKKLLPHTSNEIWKKNNILGAITFELFNVQK